MRLAVNEIFASVQGEGHWTGLPCVFLRLQGCNMDPPCAWCDTDGAQHRARPDQCMYIEDVLSGINIFRPRTVVVTGGEPLVQTTALESLIRMDEFKHIWHLETNGTLHVPHDLFEWIAASPKNMQDYEINPCVVHEVNELKFVIANADDIDWAVDFYRHTRDYPELEAVWLQPVDNDPVMVKECVSALLNLPNEHRKLGLSVQVHKLIGVK